MKKSGWGILGRAVLGLWAAFGLGAFGSAQTVAKALLAEDLAYVVETVAEVHPAFVEAGRREALADRADALLQALPDEVPRWRVGVTVAELLRPLNDGHTQTDPTFGSVRYLPLQFAWLSDGLVVAPVTGADIAIPVASEVLRVGGLSVAGVEDRLAALIPENRYAAREGIRHLPAESLLRWLNVVENDAVRLEIRTPSGETKAVRVALSRYGFEASQGLQDGYGVFWLKECRNTDEYQFFVERFFRAVTAAGVENVIISVQQNGGGNSGVVDALLAHLPEKGTRGFASDIRYSLAALKHEGIMQAQFDETVRENQSRTNFVQVENDVYRFPSVRPTVSKANHVFTGEVRVLLDSASFSSAVDMATVLSDNNLATLVGEPTGGMPTSFGDYIEFTTPGLNVPFRISYKYFVRPDPSRDPADTLMPDIPLPITVKDVQTGHSPLLRWLELLNRSQSAAMQ